MTRFVILSHNRSGSHFLQKYMDSHPAIRCAGELLWKAGKADYFYSVYRKKTIQNKVLHLINRKGSIKNYLTDFFKQHADKESVGFLLKYGQLGRFYPLLKIIEEMDLKVIHLIRSNYIIRNLAGEFRNRGIVPSGTIDPSNVHKIDGSRQTITIDPEHFLTMLHANKTVVKKFQAAFKNTKSRYLEVYYHELFLNITDQSNRILQFLGVQTVNTMSTNLIRLEPQTAAEMISNFEEVHKKLSSTEYASLLTTPEIIQN